MFEKFRERMRQKGFQTRLALWQQLYDSTTHMLDLAKNYNGETSASILLKPGEAVFATVTGASLVEDRRTGHWQGGYSGVSIPIGSIGGHAIRYHVGGSRGHYVQGAPIATSVDTGTVVVTNQRVVFQGRSQTRECLFDKLIGYQHSANGSTTFSVSNRQKPMTIHYGPKVAGWFDFRLELALAHYRGSTAELIATLQSQLAQLEASKPVPTAAPATPT